MEMLAKQDKQEGGEMSVEEREYQLRDNVLNVAPGDPSPERDVLASSCELNCTDILCTFTCLNETSRRMKV